MPDTHALGRLIATVEGNNKWSLEYIAQRMKAAGYPASKQNLSRIKKEPVRRVNPELLHGLAAGLGIGLAQVVQATLESMGLPAGAPATSLEEAVRLDHRLSAEAKRLTLALITEAVGPAGEASDGAPMKRRLAAAAPKTSAHKHLGRSLNTEDDG